MQTPAMTPEAAYANNLKAKDFVRWAMALAETGGDTYEAADRFARRWPHSKNLTAITKAAMTAGTTDPDSWAAELSPVATLASAFVELIRPRSILGRISGFRPVPFDINFPIQTAAAGVGWTGEGKPVMVSELAFDTGNFKRSKVAGIVVISRELARSADPAAEALIQRDLANGIATFSDAAFLDPTRTEVADLSPASVTNGASSVTATGTTAAAFRDDARALIEAMAAAGGQFTAPVWAMSPLMAISLALLGVDENLTMTGGTLLGVPVLTGAVPANPGSGSPLSGDGERIVLIDAAEILLADDGVDLSGSSQGMLQMNTAPDSPPTASTTMVSLFQHNLTAIMATRFLRFQRRSAGSVGVIDSANYGASA